LFAANRFWVGGTGTWNDTKHWALQSNGSGGASIPTIADDVFFDSFSFANGRLTVLVTSDVNCHSIDATSVTNRMIISGTSARKINVAGDFVLSEAVLLGFKGKIIFTSSQFNTSISAPSSIFAGDVALDGVGSWNLQSDIKTVKSSTLYLVKGTLNTNNKNLTLGNVNANSSYLRCLNLSGSEIHIKDTWDLSNPTNLNFSAGSSKIYFDELYDLNHFRGGNLSYNLVAPLTTSCVTNVSPPAQCTSNLIITLAASNVTCNGLCNGTASVVSVTGGSGNYSYLWTPSGQTTTTISGLCANTYSVRVTDLNTGAPCFCAVQVLAPSVLFDFELSTTPATCNGLCNGQSTVDATGGIPPYSFLWLPGGFTGTTVNTLCAADYTVSVTDQNNCVGSTIISVAQPNPLINTITSTSVACNGACTGSATASGSGGTGLYTFLWSPGGATTATINNLCVGSYTCVVTDTKNCTASSVAAITQPTVLSGSVSSQQNVLCNGASTGTVTVAGSNGTPSYTYSINGVNFFVSGSFINLLAGTYTVTVKDANGCTAPVIVNILQPALALTGTITAQTNILCNGGNNGSVTVAGGGGVSPYTFSLNGGTFGNSGTFSSLTAGTYTVTVKDANSCTINVIVNITQPAIALGGSITSQTNITCNGGNNGSVTVAGSNGTSPYTYALNSGSFQLSGTFSSLTAGTYTVTVKDANGCTFPVPVTIIQPIALTVSIVTQTNVSCNGGNNGSVTVSAANGTSPYTYSINGVTFQASDTFNSLTAGTYTVTAKDVGGCLATVIVTITQPNVLQVNIGTIVNVNCNGGNNGSVTVSATGGTIAYQFSIDGVNFVPGTLFSSLTAGTYTLTVRDSKGCLATATATVTQPNPIVPTLTTTSINCNGSCNASISAVVAGGTPTYTLTWLPGTPTGQGTAIITNLCAGTYTLSVVDFLGCTGTNSSTINQPTALNLITSSTNVTCFGLCNGSASAIAGGGTAPYTYLWMPGSFTTSSVSNLCAGTYSVTVRDTKGCLKTNTVIITQPLALNATLAITTSLSCSANCNGVITATPTGGTGPFTFFWSPGTPTGQGTNTISNLCAGTYNVLITDANNCTVNKTITLTQPPLLTASISNSTSSCNICNATATASANGGTAPYTYLWSPSGQTSQLATGLCPGTTYTVTITDSKGCTAFTTVPIVQTVNINITTLNSVLSCFGSCDGTATANAAGGTQPYSYLWSNNQTSQTLNGLCAATYTVTVSDALGCFNSAPVSFVNPPVLALTTTVTNATCPGACNGTATAMPTGGTPPFTYSWNTVPTQNTQTAIGLCAGTYTVTVRDSKLCTITSTATITQQNPIVDNPTYGQPSCNTNNGSITVTPSGGSGIYIFVWSPGNPTGQGTATISNLVAGTYSLTIDDGSSCVFQFVYLLNNSTAPNTSMSKTNITCNNDCNGTASVIASGGTPPYIYDWQGTPSGDGTPSIGSLCAGIYIVKVTDAAGCVKLDSITLQNPPLLTASGTVTNVSCVGLCNGSIAITASGGTGSLSYLWSGGGQTTSSLTNLCAGTYSVQITDGNLCSQTLSFTVANPPTLSVSINSTNVLCNGACNGTATAVVTGGTGPISYAWSNGPFVTPGIVNLCPNVYTVTVTDANTCTASASVAITEPPVLTATISATNITCNGLCNGSATVVANGGVSPYAYIWNPGASTNLSISNLCVGAYNVAVTDANGCLVNPSAVSITEPAVIQAGLVATNPTCNGFCNGIINANPSGGTGPYTYVWLPSGSTNQNINSLCAGTYTLVVTDAASCQITQISTLNNPPPLVPDATFTSPTCFNGCNGTLNGAANGGTGPYSFNWLPMNTNVPIVNNQCAGTYTLVVTDANSCVASQNVLLANPNQITVAIGQNTASCGLCDGIINLTPANGTTPYNYVWSPTVTGQGTNTGTQLCANTYTVVVSDFNSCSTTIVTTLSNANGPTGETVTSIPVSCFGVCDGQATIEPIGGTSPYTYLWNITPASFTTTATNLCAGNYIVQVTDANFCIHFSNVAVSTPTQISANETITSALCSNVCTGQIAVVPSGGAGGYSYQWLPGNPTGQGTSTVSGLCPGTYSLTITDVTNCSNQFTFTVGQSAPLNAIIHHQDITCASNGCSGMAYIEITSGTPPYTIQWNDPLGQVNDTASALCGGNYAANITDGNGCILILNTTISVASPIIANATISDASCGQCNGSALLVPSGGIGSSYTYLWSNNATTNSLNNLCAGLLNVNITDSVGCTVNTPIIINNTNGPTAINFTLTPITCFGLCNGSIATSVNGGVAPYSYLWLQGGQTTQSISSLCSGVYYLQVNDANGCSFIDSVNLPQPSPIVPNQTITAAACGVCDGSIVLNPNGCSGSFSYAWNNGSTVSSITNLCAGIYSVDITCSSGCTQNFAYTIITPNGPTLSISTTPISCNGVCNGSATVTASGGQLPYGYQWNVAGATAATINNLCAGTYLVVVNDNNGCASSINTQITEPALLIAATPTAINPLCHDDINGSISVAVSGGVLPYTYNWNPGGATASTISGLAPGTYSVTISDNNGCQIIQSATLFNPLALAVTGTVTNASCNTTSNAAIDITVSGGALPYSYSWTGTQTASSEDLTNIPMGTYTITITDAHLCTISTSFTVTAIETVIALAGNDTTFCQSSSLTLDGSSSINATTFGWFQLPSNTNVGISATVTVNPPLGTTNYYLLVGNSGTCTATDTISVTSLALPTANAGNDNTICAGGSVLLDAGASTSAVSYEWYTSPANVLIANTAQINVTPIVGLNTYYVIVENSMGCTANDTVLVNALSNPTANAGNDTSYCYNGLPFTLNASNSLNANAYQWFELPSNTSLGNGVSVNVNPITGSNSYYVLASNNSGCTNTDTITVSILALPIVNAGDDATILLGGNSTIGGNPTGPTNSLYVWLPSQTLNNATVSNPVATPTITTTYTVLVTNTDGCSASDNVIITISPKINPPSGFTPNDDGTNDIWRLDNITLYPNCVVEVYNRWGELLFQSTGYREPWNGTYKGKQLPVGTYYYIINLNDELFPDPITGPITIMR
jgi:gliding motility-associated-like protein